MEKAANTRTFSVIKTIVIIILVFIVAIVVTPSIAKIVSYNNAIALMDSEQYTEAIRIFSTLNGYKDSCELIKQAQATIELETAYNRAFQLLESDISENENEAYRILLELGDYKSAKELLNHFQYSVITESAQSNVENGHNYILSYEYDTHGFLSSKKDNNGIMYTYTYDDYGRLTKEAGPQSWATTEYWYNENGTLKKSKYAISESSGEIKYAITEYNEQGYPIRIVNEQTNNIWVYQYNHTENGEIETIELSCLYFESNESHAYTALEKSEFDFLLLQQRASLYCPIFWLVSEDKSAKQNIKLVSNMDTENNVYEYDYYGNLKNEIRLDSDGNIIYNYLYDNSYDKQGYLTQIRRWNLEQPDNVVYNYSYGYIYAPDAKYE